MISRIIKTEHFHSFGYTSYTLYIIHTRKQTEAFSHVVSEDTPRGLVTRQMLNLT